MTPANGRLAGGRRLPARQPWLAVAGFAFLLHFAWEMLQAPLYRGMATADHWRAVRECMRATAGDVVLTLLAYGGVALAARDPAWLGQPSAWRIAGLVLTGIAVTVALEYVSVYQGRWAYGPAMPMVGGVGLAPLVQWAILPPATIWLAAATSAGRHIT